MNNYNGIPLAKPLPAPPNILEDLMYDYEKDLIDANILAEERRSIEVEGIKAGINQAFAAMLPMLVFDYDDMSDIKTRLKIAFERFKKYSEDMGNLSEKQQFAEWYFKQQTEYELLREEEDVKPYAKDLAAMLRDEIGKKGIARKDIAKACNIKLSTLNAGILYNGTATKAQFDKIAEYIGWEMSPGVKAKYNACYVNSTSNAEKFAQIRDDLEKEQTEIVVAVKVDTPETEPETEPVEQTEDLPFLDCNEMYKELEEDDEMTEKPELDFVNFVTSMFDELKAQFIEKHKQYGDQDPLANFKRGAAIKYGGTDMNALYKMAQDYELKHIAHVFGHDVGGVKVDESLRDIAIYSIIQLYFVEMAKQGE